MIEAFKLGFAYALGAISAGLILLGVLGLLDWLLEWGGYLAAIVRFSRQRVKRGKA